MFSVRFGNLNDVENIIRLWKGMMYYHVKFSPLFNLCEDPEKFYKMYLVNSLNNPEVAYGVIYDETETILGYVRGSIIFRAPIFEKRRIGMINEIFVPTEHRRKGLGRKLTEFIFNWFNGKGVEYIELEVSSGNSDSVKFWNSLGFTNYKLKMSINYGKK